MLLRERVAPADMRQEMALVLLAARPALSMGESAAFRAVLARGVDSACLFELARWHGLLPLLGEHVRTHALNLASVDLMAALDRRRREVAQRNLLLTGRLVEVVQALEARGLDVAVFKGPALAEQLYGSIARREFCDLDVLVRPREAQRAFAVLEELRYTQREEGATGRLRMRSLLRAECHRGFLNADGITQIEVHWAFAPRYLSLELEAEASLARAKRMRLADTVVKTLSAEDLLLALAVHGSKHCWERLEWLCSFGELAGGRIPMDWSVIEGRARKAGLLRLLCAALLLVRDLLGRALSQPAASLVGGDAAAARAAAQIREGLLRRESGFASPLERARSQLLSRERLRDRVRLAMRLAFAPNARDRQSLPLPALLSPLYTVLRPLRLLRRVGAKVWHERAGEPRPYRRNP